MKRRAAAGIAVVATLFAPFNDVQAQEVRQLETRAYLVLVGRSGRSITAIPMISLDQCEEQGALWMASDRKEIGNRGWTGFECLEGAK